MMADEIQKITITGAGDMDMQSESDAGAGVSRMSQPGLQRPDDAVEWKGRYVHLLADLENTKKRLARTSAREVEAEKEALLLDVLPIADGLDLALIHTSSAEDSRNILEGIELLRNILNKFFAKYDVTPIDAWGKPFDPGLHEAIGMVRHPNVAPNTVVKVAQKGYLYHDRLLRPAQVLVASG
jgi:molecular chaperone GrpE